MKLTLRELFLLVAIAAVCCGWWAERSSIHLAKEERLQLQEERAEVAKLKHEYSRAFLRLYGQFGERNAMTWEAMRAIRDTTTEKQR